MIVNADVVDDYTS